MAARNEAANANKRKRKNLDHHNILSANIDKENLKFNTRAFMIRYCEEEVELHDIGHFRFEVDTDQSPDEAAGSKAGSALNSGEASSGNFNQTEMILEVELMFSDLLNHGGPEKFSL